MLGTGYFLKIAKINSKQNQSVLIGKISSRKTQKIANPQKKNPQKFRATRSRSCVRTSSWNKKKKKRDPFGTILACDHLLRATTRSSQHWWSPMEGSIIFIFMLKHLWIRGSFRVVFEEYPIVGIRHTISCHPLVGIFSSLGCNPRHFSPTSKVNLKPAVFQIMSTSRRPSSRCRRRII